MEEREREERQLERLPTAGNQLPVTESLLGSEEVEGEGGRRERGFSLEESKVGGKVRCQSVCLRKACRRGSGEETEATGSRGERRW